MINYEYPPIGGGAGNATHFLSKALQKQGHQITILTTAFKEHTGYINDEGRHLYRISSPRRHDAQASTYEMAAYVTYAFFYIPRIIKKHHITHAIIFFSIPCGPLGLFLNKFFKIPFVNSLRGGDVPGLVEDLDNIHLFIRPLRRWILRSAKANIANAKGLANLSRQADPCPIDVIPNGVDTDYFQPPKTNKRDETIHFIFVGRFHEQKNLFFMLKHLSIVQEKNDKSIHLHLVGDGPLTSELKSEAENLKLSKFITWHGWLTKEELKDLYQQVHVMINPSHYEGLPNTVLEGMASALPVIASDIPGNNDLILHQKTGYLFDLKNALDFENCLLETLNKDTTILGNAARERAIEFYSWDSTAKQYEDKLLN